MPSSESGTLVKLDGTPKKSRAGRPPKLTYELVDKACALIGKDHTKYTAFATLDISREMLNNWITRAEGAKGGVYKYLLTLIQLAEARRTQALFAVSMEIATNRDHGYDAVSAGMIKWSLARLERETFGDQQKVDMTVTKDQHDTIIIHTGPVDPEIAALIDQQQTSKDDE